MESSSYETTNLFSCCDLSAGRIGQIGALNCIKSRIRSGHKTVSIVLPTRYGKSDVMRLAAIEMADDSLVCCSLLCTPVTFLRNQLASKDKIKQMVSRWTVQAKRKISYDVLKNFTTPIVSDGDYFTCMTIPMLTQNIDSICKWITQKKNKTGLPTCVFVDEVHSTSEKNTWGSCVDKIINAGGIVVLLTATAWRADGHKIPGFKFDKVEEREYERHIPRPHENPGLVWVDVLKTIAGKVTLRPDYEYTFRQAWAENNVLCRLSRHCIDVEIEIQEDLTCKPIKDFSVSETLKYLGKITRNHKVISRGVEMQVDRIEARRKHMPTTGGIVFCGNDIDGDDINGHAKIIKQQFLKLRPDWVVLIATNKSEDDANDIIEQFKKGHGDVLIVKQMASLGLDVERLKVGLDLSSVRTLAAWIQRVMRIGTMWDKVSTADFISPSDVLSDRLWVGLVDKQGGTAEMRVIESELVERYESLKQDQESKSILVKNVSYGAISDHASQLDGSKEDYEVLNWLCSLIPSLVSIHTSTELIDIGRKLLANGLHLPTPEKKNAVSTTVIVNRDSQCENLRNKINELADRYAKSLGPTTTNEWVTRRKFCINNAKKYANAGYGELKSIRDIETLQRIAEYIDSKLSSMLKPIGAY